MAQSSAVRLGWHLVVLCGALSWALGCDKPGAAEKVEAENAAKSAAAARTAEVLQQLIAKQAAEREQKQPERAGAASDVQCKEGREVDFHEPQLEAEVRRKLGKPTGAISQSELATIRSVNLARGGSVDYLDPCVFPHLTGVKDLYLGPGKLSDLSVLRHLRRLTTLRASMNAVSDISVLSGHAALERVDLGHTRVSDLRPLENAKNLTELMLDDTLVEDISPLAGLDKLQVLALSRTQVNTLKPLAGLKKLKSVSVVGAPVARPYGLPQSGLRIVDR